MLATLIISTIISFYSSSIVANENYSSPSKPTRSECIAGAYLNWGKDEKEISIINKTADLGEIRAKYPIGGISIPTNRTLFIIFTESCDKKNEMLRCLLSAYKGKISEFPSYTIINDKITPSLDTILTYGDYWSDGHSNEP